MSAENPQFSKKTVWSWAFYDWANSVYATTVMAGFFPIFFKEFCNAGVASEVSTFRLGLANSIASLIILFLAPIMGAIADQTSAKKKFLAMFAFMGATFSCALYFIAQGQWLIAMLLYTTATIGFSGANIFYDALLPLIAPESKLDRVSALGYGMGYLGGGVVLAINTFMVLQPETFGFADAGVAVKVSFVMAGIWWALFTLPLVFVLKEPTFFTESANEHSFLKIIGNSFNQVKVTFSEIRKIRMLFLFLFAYWLYIDGVDTIYRMAVDYGISLGFDSNVMIQALLMVQFVGFPGVILYGYFTRFVGRKMAVFIAIGMYLFVTVWGAFIQTETHFFIIAGIIAFAQGGLQAISRSMYASMIPRSRSAEFFGIYNMLGKFAAVIGPMLMGGVALLLYNMGFEGNTATRGSIMSIALLFIAGGTVFYFVDEQVGRQQVADLYGEEELSED